MGRTRGGEGEGEKEGGKEYECAKRVRGQREERRERVEEEEQGLHLI